MILCCIPLLYCSDIDCAVQYSINDYLILVQPFFPVPTARLEQISLTEDKGYGSVSPQIPIVTRIVGSIKRIASGLSNAALAVGSKRGKGRAGG